MKKPTKPISSKFRKGAEKSIVALTCACLFVAAGAQAGPVGKPEPSSMRVAVERTGILTTAEGLTLRLTTDLGSVKILTQEEGASPVVRYAVHLETDARAPLAQKLLTQYSLTAKSTPLGVEIAGNLPPQATHLATSGSQLWVQFEITVPRDYNVDVKTEGGDIETGDIGGIAALTTAGGSIRAGNIGVSLGRRVATGRMVARLETDGGHIQVSDVAGDLTAFTAGGHINAGNIAGRAELHSGGGHIRASQISGQADLQTDGGNITVGQASNLVSVRTGGGQIDFGEVRGSVRAQTGGGGIRIMYVAGPMEVESSAGSICLTKVAGTVKAATAGGTITAWINPEEQGSESTVHLSGISQLSSGNGDIVVFLPRNLAADIEAVVDSGGERRIEADPALALKVQRGGDGPLRALASLNGGGPTLKLRTTAGKIKLQFLDSEVGLRQSLIQQQRERLAERLSGGSWTPAAFARMQPVVAPPVAEAEEGDWIDRWLSSLESTFFGAVREDPDELQRHLISAPPPGYPEIARRAGVQGLVRIQVRVSKEGRVEVDKVLNGSPTLADAAICAVKQWRARPFTSGGRPIDVISTVTFNFQLH